jgi:hypothetical protein
MVKVMRLKGTVKTTVSILVAFGLGLCFLVFGSQQIKISKYSADACAAVIVGVQCIGQVVSGTGNSNEGGGLNRPSFLSMVI